MLIGLWITTGCNLRCNYCYEGQEKKQENMTRNMADKAILFIKKHYQAKETSETSPLVIEFHGGEPLLNYEIIPYIVEKLETEKQTTLYGITTNGLLLDQNKIDYLSEKMTYGFSISIDGTQHTHDRYRVEASGKGSYENIVTKIPYLLEKNPNTRARMTYTPETVGDLSGNIIHLIELGFHNIVSGADYYSKNWTQVEMALLLEETKKIANYYESNNLQEKGTRISVLEDRFKCKGLCQGGTDNFHILPNGTVYPCSYGIGLEELEFGNILEEELNYEKINALVSINKQANSQCEGCNGYDTCISSRCKIFNKVIGGDYLHPLPIICALEHVKLKIS